MKVSGPKKKHGEESGALRPRSKRDPFSEFYRQIEEKYKDILSLSAEDMPYEYVTGIGDLYEKILFYEIFPTELDDFLSKVSSDLMPMVILDVKAAIADGIGEMMETYRYESTEEGRIIEDYLDELLEVVRQHEEPKAEIQKPMPSTFKAKIKKKEISAAEIMKPKQGVPFD